MTVHTGTRLFWLDVLEVCKVVTHEVDVTIATLFSSDGYEPSVSPKQSLAVPRFARVTFFDDFGNLPETRKRPSRIAIILKRERETFISNSLEILGVGVHQAELVGDRRGGN